MIFGTYFHIWWNASELFSGYGANGAIIHYKPTLESCSVVDEKNLFLLDSGGQYVDGTTDITRTVHFGEPSARQRECFTRVLQVSIQLFCVVCFEGWIWVIDIAFALWEFYISASKTNLFVMMPNEKVLFV